MGGGGGAVGERGEQQREGRERKRDDRVGGGVKWEVGREVTGRQNGTLRRRRQRTRVGKTGFRAQIVAPRKSGRERKGVRLGREAESFGGSQLWSSSSCWIAGGNLIK